MRRGNRVTPIVSDAALIRGLSVPLPGLRRSLARRAAARGLHAPALTAEPGDPAVLTSLGLYLGALSATAHDDIGRHAQTLAAAALGMPVDETAVARAPESRRRQLAYASAAADPLRAAALLAEEPAGRAACLLAGGRIREAAACVGAADMSPESLLVTAAAAAEGGDVRMARNAIRQLFEMVGLAAPLEPDGGAFTLDDFTAEGSPVTDGPLVSVIVPLHDGAATIKTALCSLVNQSWRRIEIIVCDDRSCDDGPAIVSAMAADDPRIRLIANLGAPGASGARNCAIAAAQGAFVAFLDADDWAHPARIARQMARLDTRSAATVSRHFRIDDRGCPVAPRVAPMIRLCPISMIVRCSVLSEIGGFEISRAGADAELLGRIETTYGRRAVPRDPAPLTVARWRAASISNDPERGLFDRERLIYRERWMRAHARLFASGGLPRSIPAT